MAAIAALVCFIVALIEPKLGPINMVTLGLAFVALHLVYPVILWNRNSNG